MPELPDVEVFKRYLDATSLHKKIKKMRMHDTRVLRGITGRMLQKRLADRQLEKTRRHGKHLFVRVGDMGWLRLHFGMTGFLRYFKRAGKKPDHVAMTIRFVNGFCLAYDNQRRLGQVGWVDSPEEFAREEGLGPDALNDLNFDRFKDVMSGRRGFVKSALMNQQVIAGIGNVYADEILFQSRIRPRARVEEITAKDLQRLFDAIQKVLRTAVRCKADPEAFPKDFLIRNRGKNRNCPRCGGRIEKVTVSGRSGYACPNCQT
jgi:formamidopyrimidine-DNA glycosylase